jgi:hypothetical protein
LRKPATVATGLGLLMAVGLGCTGCASGDQQVTDQPLSTLAYPVVEPGQAGSILNAVNAALLRGVTATDTDSTVDARLVGPFREVQLANAKIAAQEKKDPAKPAQMQRLRLIVPTSQGWPRFFIAVGNESNSSTPVLQVLSSTAARAPYGLWAEATMLPGATLPETASAGTGSPTVSPDQDDGLAATPKEVISGFAGYLTMVAKTTSSKQYRRSVFSDQLLRQLAADKKGLKSVATVTSTHRVDPAVTPLAVRTSDGGALVIGSLQQTYEVKVKKGSGTVKVSDPDLAALAGGKKQFSKSFTRTADEVVVFNVPPRGRGLITLIAAEKADVKAVAR